ncbi:3383_t:CDS:1, partial [Cetraspora pellucida]
RMKNKTGFKTQNLKIAYPALNVTQNLMIAYPVLSVTQNLKIAYLTLSDNYRYQ